MRGLAAVIAAWLWLAPAGAGAQRDFQAEAEPKLSAERRVAIARKLVAALGSKDAATRRVAADELGYFAAEAVKAGAVPKLVAMARADKDAAAREAALLAILQIGPPAARDAAPLLEELTDIRDEPPPGRMRGYALAAMGRLKLEPKLVVKTAVPYLAHWDDFNRAAAEDALVELGKEGVPMIAAAWALLDGPGVRRELAEVLARIGPDARAALPALIAACDDPDVDVALPALGAVSAIDPADRSIDERAAKLLARAKERWQRWQLLRFLAGRGAKAAAAAPEVEKLLADADVGSDAAETLLAIAPSAASKEELAKAFARDLAGDSSYLAADRLVKLGEPGIAALRAAAADKRPQVRRAALGALGGAPPDKATVALLEKVLAADADEELRAIAAGALGRLGEGHGAAALVKALKSDTSTRVRGAAAYALGTHGDRGVDALVAALDDADEGVRAPALTALGAIGAPAVRAIPALLAPRHRPYDFQRAEAIGRMGAAAVPPLRSALKDPKLTRIAVDALVKCGPAAAPAVLDFARLLSSPDRDLRLSAALGLMVIRDKALPALPDLISALTDPDDQVRSRAVAAIRGIGPAAREALPDLRTLMSDDFRGEEVLEAMIAVAPDAVEADLLKAAKSSDDGVRSAALDGLARLGPSRPAVVKLLRAALKDPDPGIRWRAAEALLTAGDEGDWLPAQIVLREAPEAARAKWMQPVRIEAPPPID